MTELSIAKRAAEAVDVMLRTANPLLKLPKGASTELVVPSMVPNARYRNIFIHLGVWEKKEDLALAAVTIAKRFNDAAITNFHFTPSVLFERIKNRIPTSGIFDIIDDIQLSTKPQPADDLYTHIMELVSYNLLSASMLVKTALPDWEIYHRCQFPRFLAKEYEEAQKEVALIHKPFDIG